MEQRESLGSRLGFILLSAGCAIGIGNVWKFPYITGQYGGGAFVVIYLIFLILMGAPIMTMEFAIGRASRKSPFLDCKVLEKPGTKWHYHGYLAIVGNYLLMMFYTTVTGWMLYYFYKSLTGHFNNASVETVSTTFTNMTANPYILVGFMIITVVIGFLICSLGVQNGVEKITKVMMLALLALIILLAIHSMLLKGGTEGLKFYLVPDFNKVAEIGLFNVIVAAMNQAFFTLSLGIGAMSIFGSYIGKEQSLFGESIRVCILDTFVAIFAGLIIFPACSAFGVNADSGPSLIFVTLPNIFSNMTGGQIWGSLFFLFMSFAAFSTVIAVFEGIIACFMDMTGVSRKKSCYINIIIMIILSLPCALGFNILSGVNPLGAGSTILDFEDFLVSDLILPIGSLIYLLFCVCKNGWGWDNFIKEANTGKGIKLSSKLKIYLTYVLPLLIIFKFIIGLKARFF